MNQSIKILNQSTKILGNHAEFPALTQTTNFYIQDLFQTIFLTSMHYHITQKHIKNQQRMIYLVS